ncbi:hypothetical protein GCM10009069_23500 [Algimonas arctica]|uniref:Uncharacterized protein n=1 Tax=Algimonas arctica TaxID=1479486 RepID=A0A8J3CTM4_9PROT|nr:hypothetical protein [Algimonas arctica]GHA99985.1 hypothetical protein GCM10009069_23500 [Algimonas arctica]
MTRSTSAKTIAKRAALTLGVLGTLIAIAPAASAAPSAQSYKPQSAATLIVAPRTTVRTHRSSPQTVHYVRELPAQKPMVIKRAAPDRKIKRVARPQIIIVTPPKPVKKSVTTRSRHR